MAVTWVGSRWVESHGSGFGARQGTQRGEAL